MLDHSPGREWINRNSDRLAQYRSHTQPGYQEPFSWKKKRILFWVCCMGWVGMRRMHHKTAVFILESLWTMNTKWKKSQPVFTFIHFMEWLSSNSCFLPNSHSVIWILAIPPPSRVNPAFIPAFQTSRATRLAGKCPQKNRKLSSYQKAN